MTGSDDSKFSKAIDDYNETRSPQFRHAVCHAPSVSMNFDQSGAVTACCYTRDTVLGRYPESSIGQIWRSPEADRFRQELKNNQLKNGCLNCKDQIEGKNFEQTLARNFDVPLPSADGSASAGPLIFEFELSNVCNLECVMCNGHFSSLIRKNREKLPALTNPYDDRFVEQLREFWKTVVWARFLGGEPFLNSLYFKIWRQILEENAATKVIITTNATIINKNVEWVLENVKPYMVFSLDSLQKDTYEKIRKNASFEKTQENLTRFMDYGFKADRDYSLSVCPMIYNWQEIPAIFDWGLQNLATVYLNRVTHPPEMSLRSLSARKLREIAREYRSHRIKTWRDFWSSAPPWLIALSDSHERKFECYVNQIEYWANEKSDDGISSRHELNTGQNGL